MSITMLLVVGIVILLLNVLSILFHTGQTDAQLGPVPLPAPQLPSGSDNKKEIQDSSDEPISPLKVQIINKQLSEGKNVLRIQIPPEHKISNCMIYYITHSTNKVTQCVKDSSSTYKGLIDAEYPNQTIKVMVSDNFNKTVTVLSNLSVQKGFSIGDILQVISDWICKNIKEC
jgi:hypothetical protein